MKIASLIELRVILKDNYAKANHPITYEELTKLVNGVETKTDARFARWKSGENISW